MSDHALVICSCPDSGAADSIARHLVGEKLAACVNQIRNVNSTYEWQGELQSSDEILLVIKTRPTAYPKLEAAIRKMHPYELPEVIMVPITAGLPEYLAWIDTQTTKN